jgi:hypothetical protein
VSLFELVFGCSHQRCSFPITVRGKLRRSAAASVTGTYVVCLDCGQEFPYDWNEMKMVRSKPGNSPASNPITVAPGNKAA